MATTAEHHSKWVHNRNFLAAVSDASFDDWRSTIAFYACVHAVESLFYHHDQHDSANHHARNARLKQNPRYAHIWRSYKHLWNASLVARYMCDDLNNVIPDFFSWITADQVRDILIGKHMFGVEQAVVLARGLKPEDFQKLT